MVDILMKYGEDVRKEEWYKKCTDEIIKQYVLLRERIIDDPTGKNVVRIEIILAERQGRFIDPIWNTTVRNGDKLIPLPVKEDE